MATRIGELKKPSVSAWTVNQLARNRELDVQRLIKAGDALEQAHRDAISGGDSSGFAAARREEGDVVRRLRDAAEELLPAASTAMLDRVERTLRAGAATTEGRRLIKQGRLVEDLEPPGFEAFSGLAAAAPPRDAAAPSRVGERKQLRRQIDSLRQRKRKAEATAKERADEAAELERRAREADQAAKQARKAAASGRKRAEDAATQVRRLQDELEQLQQRGR